MRLFYTLLVSFFIQNISAQDIGSCDDFRYRTDVFAEVESTIDLKFGEGNTFAGNFQELFMNIYEPKDDIVDARPAIILAFGGSFISGQKEDIISLCEAYARKGYVAITIDYRLYDGFLFPIPSEEDVQEVVVKAIGDMKAAVRFLREDAANDNLFRVHPDYIFVGGISAGAIVAAHTSTLDSTDMIEPGLLDLVAANGGFEGNASSNYAYSSEVQGFISLSGGLNDASWIDANDPPFVSYHDDNDGVVPFAEGYASIFGFNIIYLEGREVMHEVADSVGITNELNVIENSNGHVSYLNSTNDAIEVLNRTSQFVHDLICSNFVSTQDANVLLEVEVNPNPTSGLLHLEFDAAAQFRFSLFDVLGQSLGSWENTTLIDLSNFTNGVYFLKMQNVETHHFATQKIILER